MNFPQPALGIGHNEIDFPCEIFPVPRIMHVYSCQ